MGKWTIELQYLPFSSTERVLFRFFLPDIVAQSARPGTLPGLAIAGETKCQSSTAIALSVTGPKTCLQPFDKDEL